MGLQLDCEIDLHLHLLGRALDAYNGIRQMQSTYISHAFSLINQLESVALSRSR